MASTGLTRNALQFFIDNLPEPMFAVDPELRYLAFNQAHATVMRSLYGTDVARGRSYVEVMASAADRAATVPNLQRALRGEPLVSRVRPSGPLGASRCFEVAYVPLRGSEGEVLGVGVVSHDLTDAQRALEAERSLRQSEEAKAALEAHVRQQQKLEALGTLASGVAHEINNPINVIANYAELIAEEVTTGPAHEYARQVIAEAERVARIVRDLLRFARQDRSACVTINPSEILADTISLVEAALRKDHIRFEAVVEPDLPTMSCRPQQIQQVLTNLLTNARDALNERWPGPSPDKRLLVWATRVKRAEVDWVRFEVEDHGAGMVPDVAARVFDPFFTTKDRDKGTGLGLSISHGIVHEHGGRIGFEAVPGGGTRFHVELKAG